MIRIYFFLIYLFIYLIYLMVGNLFRHYETDTGLFLVVQDDLLSSAVEHILSFSILFTV